MNSVWLLLIRKFSIAVCLQKALNNFRFRVRIFIIRLFFRYVIPEFVQENRVLYLDCDMIFTQDLLPLFEVDLNGFGIRAVALAHQKEQNLHQRC